MHCEYGSGDKVKCLRELTWKFSVMGRTITGGICGRPQQHGHTSQEDITEDEFLKEFTCLLQLQLLTTLCEDICVVYR